MTRRRKGRTTAVAWVAAVAIVVGVVSVGILKVLPDCWRSHPTWSVGQCLSELVSPTPPPELPRLPAKPLAPAQPQLTVSWTDNSGGAATTRVERRLGSQNVYSAYVDIPPGVTSYVDTTVSAGTAYCYRAMAYDNDGSSPYSPEACGTPAADPNALNVSVTRAGTGAGTVTSAPAGINCGTACSASYAGGSSVTLSATAASGSAFTGWSGGPCSGTAPCTVAGNTAVAVTASFGAVSTALTVGPTSGAAGTEFVVTLVNWSGSAYDWVTIAPAGAGNTTYGAWAYVPALTNSGGTRTWRITLGTPGTFEARLFLNGVFTRAATSPTFTVASATASTSPSTSPTGAATGNPTVAVTPTSGAAGTEFVVTLANWSGSAYDWLAVAPAGAGNMTYGAWVYVGPLAGSGGTKTWRMTPTTAGTFEVRLFLNGAFTLAATSPAFTVATSGATGATTGSTGGSTTGSTTGTTTGGTTGSTSGAGGTITITPTSGPSGTEYVVTLSGWSGTYFDWLAVAPAGAANTVYAQWVYVGRLTDAAGTRTWRVTPTTTGTSEVRLFLNNGFTRAATGPTFTVTP